MSESASSPAAPKRRGLLAFLFGTWGGRALVAFALLAGLVLALPTLASGWARGKAEEFFAEHHRGSLKVGELALAWFSEQRVKDAVLADPDGKEVARVSVLLPSLLDLARSGGTKLGRVRVECAADLVADDAGVTNLERALARRQVAPEDAGQGADDAAAKDSKGGLATLAELELELELRAPRIRWSDAETRRLGQPFELANLVLRGSAKPGAPITVKADAAIAGDAPGAFAIDAKVHGPITPGAEWPFGTIEATGNVKGFSGALVDGLAGQQGRLKELLGPAFDLAFTAKDVTRDQGELALELTSPATKLALAARIEHGVVRASGERFLDASIALPRAYLDAFVVPHLPPGSKLDFGARAQAWSVRIDAFEARIPSFAELDRAHMAPLIEAATARLFVSMPSAIGFENAETQRAFGRACALEGTALEVVLAPKAPPRVALRSTLVANTRSPLSLTASSKDLWKALADGAAPHADLDLELVDVPVAALDAALGTNGRLAAGVGDVLRVVVKVGEAGRDRGRIDARVTAPKFELTAPLQLANGKIGCADGQALRARLDAPAGWIEGWLAGVLPAGLQLTSDDGHCVLTAEKLIVPLPPAQAAADPFAFLRGATRGELKLELPSVRISTPATRAAKAPVRLFGGMLDAKLSEGGNAQVIASVGLDTGPTGNVSTRVVLDDAWSLLPKDGRLAPRPFEAMFDVSNVSSALVGAFAGADVAEQLGDPLELHVEAHEFDLANGRIAVQFQSARVGANFTGRLERGVLRATGAEGLAVSVNPAPGAFERVLAPFLPAGTEVAMARASDGFALEVRELELTLPDFAAGASFALEPMLDGLRARLGVRLPNLEYSDANTRAARVAVALERALVTATLRADRALELKVDAALVAGERGTLHGELVCADPWFALRAPARPMPALDGSVKLAGFPTNVLDALAGPESPERTGGLVSKLLGPALDVDVQFAGVTAEAGTVELGARSASMRLACKGAMKDGAFTTTDAKGLELALQLPAGWLEEQLSPRLPAGARLSVPTDVQPLVLVVKNLRVPLAPPAAASASKPAPGDRNKPAVEEEAVARTLAFVAGMALDLELTVPELVYADAQTDAAGRALAIRGLKAAAKLAPDAQPFVHLGATVDGEPPGELAADVRALDALKLLAEEHGLDRFRISCDLEARGVPTALVDALAGQGGLLVEALGSRVQVTVKSASLSKQEGALVADLVSDLHSVHVEGAMRDGAFRVTKQSGIDARVGLGPVMNARVVGRLVPMLVNLKKPDGSPPTILAVDAMSFPLDGNLRGLDADVRIDLGEVTYALLPGLDQIFGNAVELKPTKIPALTVPITKGVAGYKDLKLRIAGTEYAFSGSFDLVDLTLKLDTGVPLKLLGKKVNKEIDKVREYVSPDLVVPIEIRGAWNKPKVSVGDAFVKKLVEDAAKKGLGDLLDGLLKKKKD